MISRTLRLAETGNSMDIGGDSLFLLIEQKGLFINHYIFMIPYELED